MLIPAVLTVLGALLVACAFWVFDKGGSSAPPSPPPRSPGVEVPTRLVSLAPAVTEMVFALEKGGLLVGRTRFCDRPEEALAVPVIGDYLAPDVEKVLSVHPDLVLVSKGPGNRGAVLKLESLGIQVETMSLYSVDEVLAAIGRLGVLLAASEKAGEVISDIRSDLKELKKEAGKLHPVNTLFVIGHDPFVLAAPGSIPSELLEAAGGRNLAPNVAGKSYVSIEKERLSALKPQVVLDASLAGTITASGRTESSVLDPGVLGTDNNIGPLDPSVLGLLAFYRSIPGWGETVRIEFPANDAVFLPGVHLAEGARVIFELLHPADG